MTRIKICGLRRKEDVDYVNECEPDYVGFVFAKSRRKVTGAQAKVLRSMLKPGIIPVGVFVNEEASTVAGLVREGVIEMVQLHGEETEDYIRTLRSLAEGVIIVKAVRVASQEDVLSCRQSSADYLLFDSFSFKEHGGTGKVFDWSLTEGVEKPFFLAGGINGENVREALLSVRPFAVDVSSAVETDGDKDREKIIGLVTRVKKFNETEMEE